MRAATWQALLADTGPRICTDIPKSEEFALRWLYNHTNGKSWTTKTNWLTSKTAANWFGITVTSGHVANIQLNANNLVGSIEGWNPAAFPRMVTLDLYTNASLTGRVSNWALPPILVNLRMHATGLSGNVANWILPSTLTNLNVNGLAGLTGDVSGWVLPAGLLNIYLNASGVSGSLNSWIVPALVADFYMHTTVLTGVPSFAVATGLSRYSVLNCGLTQANVNALIAAIYARRATFTVATPSLDISGTNQAASGTYQAANPPTTGKEMIYSLKNDNLAEGFHKWTVTYTA